MIRKAVRQCNERGKEGTVEDERRREGYLSISSDLEIR